MSLQPVVTWHTSYNDSEFSLAAIMELETDAVASDGHLERCGTIRT